MSDIRDAVCLARAGEALGPAGDMYLAWRKLARINLTLPGQKDQVRKLLPDPVAEKMSEPGASAGPPVAQAAQVLSDVLRAFPRQEAAALMLADVMLARAVGWDRVMPLLATHMARKDIRTIADGEVDPMLCVHRDSRAIQIDTLTGINLRLAVKRQMICKPAHQNMRQQAGTRSAPFNRARGHRGLRYRLTARQGER